MKVSKRQINKDCQKETFFEKIPRGEISFLTENNCDYVGSKMPGFFLKGKAAAKSKKPKVGVSVVPSVLFIDEENMSMIMMMK